MAIRGLEGNMQAQPRVFAHDAVPVTKSDTVDIPNTSERGCCLYVGDISAGADIKVTMESGNQATFKGVTAGSFLPVLVTRVWSTGTTADQILALYLDMFIGMGMPIPDLANLPGPSRPGGGGSAFEYTAIDNSFSMLFDPAGTTYFTVTDDIFGGMTEFTIAFWYKADTLSADRTVLGKWTGFSDIILYHDNPSGWRILMSNASPAISRQSNVTATAGVWQHLVCKYDGSEVKFYLNGGATTDAAANAATTIPSFTNMNVGIDLGGPSSGRPWDGRLDELAIFNKALSDETVQAIYNTTANNPGKVADLSETPEGAPVAWYRMGD